MDISTVISLVVEFLLFLFRIPKVQNPLLLFLIQCIFQWRIQDFPDRGANPWFSGKYYCLAKSSLKLYEDERNESLKVRVHSAAPPPRSVNGFWISVHSQCSDQGYIQYKAMVKPALKGRWLSPLFCTIENWLQRSPYKNGDVAGMCKRTFRF